MKTCLIVLLACTFSGLQAQGLILTQAANEPQVGDSSYYYVLDSSAYPNILPTAVTGSNVVWNFTNLNVLGISANSAYLSPSAVPASSAYPGSTVVQKQGALYNFFKSISSPQAQTHMLGSESGSLSITFTNSAMLAQYPMAYGNSFTDNVAGAFTYSINGTFTGSVSSVADGSGTLQLPGGVVFSNVLRVKSTQKLNLSLGIIPAGTAMQTVYNYFHASKKFPLLNITYTSLNLLGSSSPTVSAVVTANSKVVTVGLKEEEFDQAQLPLYPNPSSEFVMVDLGLFEWKLCHCEIYDYQARLLYAADLNPSVMNPGSIPVSQLAEGVYLLKIHSDSRTCHKTFAVLR
ncbi:MAG TPA: hypothetical protein PLQ93_09955 [Bacteroidia bacterium]|nr:hypothetical protein [Bacteroidia bacterium]